jgi:hypothetical protein
MNDYSCSVDEPVATPARYFTVESANRALVLVRRVVADIVSGYRRLMDLQETLEALQGQQSRARCEELRSELIGMVERLQTYLGELEAVGVELRDWSQGMIDFPSMWQGRQIMLSWKHGEPAMTHWHETAESFISRQPLSNLAMEQLAVPVGK